MEKVEVHQPGGQKTYWCRLLEMEPGAVVLYNVTDREGGETKWERVIILQGIVQLVN